MAEAKPRIGFIGAGRVGSALAVSISGAGYPVVAVASRSPESAQALASLVPDCRICSPQEVADLCDLVFITTPDSAIREICNAIAWRPGTAVVHTSGAEPAGILEKAAEDGALTGSLHPLQTFADGAQARANLPLSVFGVEAAGSLKLCLLDIVAALGGKAVELDADQKALYHVAAVLVSNYTVTLAKLATDLWLRLGWQPSESLRALLPLLKGTVSNLDALGLPAALTGPVARGDISTVERHLATLEATAPGIVDLYRELALQTIPLALEKGSLGPEAAEALETVLERRPAAANVRGG